jgi:isopenicillin N synthase-like dioxygenase
VSGNDTGVPLIDLAPWFSGDAEARAALAAEVDAALQRVGFLVVTGHGVSPELVAAVRAAGHEFFALSDEVKQRYSAKVGGRGWLAIGAEANGYSEGTETPPDLKESYVVGSQGDGGVGADAAWFVDNIWPSETPGLQSIIEEYLSQMRALADALLALCAKALGKDESFITAATTDPSWSFQLNWYPSRVYVGEPAPGQYRIGPHTDFGTLTLLDRQPGAGGLQVDIEGEGWVDAPHVEGALVVNTGDLLARWTGQRWYSNRHRVLPPPASAPNEELLSLVYFFEADPAFVVEPMQPPLGRNADLPPVRAGDFLRERYDAITMS